MKKRLMSLLLVCSMILSLFTGLSVTALAGDVDPATATPTPTAADAFTMQGRALYLYSGIETNVVIPAEINGTTVGSIDQGAFAIVDGLQSVVIPSTVRALGDYVFDYQTSLTDVYFYGPAPTFSDEFIDIYADDIPSFTLHCKSAYASDYEGIMEENSWSGYATVEGDIVATLADPAYSASTPDPEPEECKHTETKDVVTKAATCTEAGSKNIVCADCDAVIETGAVINALGHNIVAGKCTREGCDYTEPAQEDLFQKFFESKTADMTAVNSTDKAWTALLSGLKYKLKASGSEEKVFTLTMKKGGYLTVKGTVSQPMAKVTAADANKKTVGTLSSTSYMPTTTAFEAQVKTGDVITFTYSSCAYAGSSYYVEITDITLDTSCPHSLSQEIPAEAATCTKDGNNLYYECLVCKGKFKDKACMTPMTDAEAIIPASHTYDESRNVSVDGGKATVKSCSICKLTTVVAGSGEGTPAYTVTLSDEHLTFTAEGKTGTSYTVGSGKDLYFLAKVDSGYVITNVTNAVVVDGYDGLYKVANVTSAKTITLTTAEAPKAEYSFELRTENGTQVAYIKGYLGEGGDNGTITLPTSATVNGKDYPVVGVAERAFNVSNGSVDGVKSGDSLAKIKKIIVPAEIKKIEAFAFCYIGKYQSYNLQGIVFEGADTVFAANTSSQNSQLSSNPNLTTVTLPANLTEIPSSLFSGDTKLDHVTIPKGVTKIGKDAFKGCTGLKTVTMKSGTAPTVEIGDRPNNNYPFAGCTVTVIVPKGAKAAYETAWAAMMSAGKDKGGDITIQEPGGSVYFAQFEADDIAYNVISMSGSEYTAEVRKVKKTSGSKLNGASGTLTIPETVTITKADTDFTFTIIGIGEKALYEYENGYSSSDYWFAEVKFPGTLQYIGKWGCSGLAGVTEIDLSNTKVTDIGNYAFYGSKLTTVTVPAAAKTDTGAFMNCADLTTATVNGTKLDRYMFWYCTGLTTLTAPNVTEIDECALGYCVKLTSLLLAKVTSIGHGAFRNCHGLTAVTIPGSVRSFGKYVFADCGNLSSVTFVGNANVTSLPEGTFYECVKLKEVHLGDGISQTESLSLYMAGWSNGMKVDVYCNQPEEYFFRNEFDTCFIDLGNQQFDSENKEKTEITYIWANTTYNNGEPVYHFKAASSGGCGGGCCGGGAVGADGMAEYTMSPSVNAVFHYTAADQGAALANLTPARASALYSALPTVLTVEVRDKKTNQITETYKYTLSDLESMAQTTLAGYQYVGMKGWAVMAATEYVTIDDLIGGEPLTGTDTITLYAGDGATYSASGADLQQNSYFFPASSDTNSKVTNPATPVPAIIALEWNTGKIEVTPDSSALSAVAATAYKSTNLRFAHGLSLTFPGADVRKLADKNAKLELITALGSVTLDAASLKGFGSSELVLTIEKLLCSTLSAALQNELDLHAAIYNVRATCGGAAVTSLSGKAQITLPYTLQTGEKAAAVRTSLHGSSTLSKLTAAYGSGSVSFETSVLATFAVDVPDKQNSVTIPLTPVVKDGAASAALPTAEAEEALAKLTEGGELILDARTAKTVTASVIQDMIEKKLSLQTVMNGAQVGLDAAALTSAYGKLTGTNLRICAEQLANSDLPKAARSDVQTADLWHVWLTDGIREVTELTGSIRLTLAYTLRKGQSAADMTAYAVNDNGTYTALRASNDKSAYTLSFTGSRLGIFALTDLLDGELPFRDVYTSDWYYDDVRYVYENGLMNGVTTTQFAPKTDITRGMLVTILYRVEGEPVALANPFKDVASGSYYEAAIAWAETRGIVNGFGGGLFRPNAPITREQFVAILYRYAAYKGLQTTASASLSAFADAASVSGWAVDAVRWAVGSGLMNGKNGKIVPAGLTIRAEAAALLHRYLA